MLTVTINEKSYTLETSITLKHLLTQQGCDPQLCAVAINQKIIPKQLYDNTWVAMHDDIMIITPMAGG